MEISEKWKRHWVLDVESDGPCPGLYNMISFGLVNIYDPSIGIGFMVKPEIMSPGIKDARAVSGVSYDTQYFDGTPIETAIKSTITRVQLTSATDRFTIWSDNPAFDWQFWNYYCHKYYGYNPAGFSARRIGDLDAGRRKDPFNTNAWKKRRVTDHTHDPVDDARGNAEALRWILGEM